MTLSSTAAKRSEWSRDDTAVSSSSSLSANEMSASPSAGGGASMVVSSASPCLAAMVRVYLNQRAVFLVST